MKNLKKAIKVNNKLLIKSKNYLILKLNNNDKNVIKKVYTRLNKNFLDSFILYSKSNVYLNIGLDLNNYFNSKKKIENLLTKENFSYNLLFIKINKNVLNINFFENNLFLNKGKIEIMSQIFLCSYIHILVNNIYMKINLFLILNVFFHNYNILKLVFLKLK